jgi:hypothetical protein
VVALENRAGLCLSPYNFGKILRANPSLLTPPRN